MAQILLFNQYFTSKIGQIEKNTATLPINLLHLATYLNSKGLACNIFELGLFDGSAPLIIDNKIRFGITDIEIITIIKKNNPKIIGISCMFSRHYLDVINIARLIKKTDPSIKIVTGGNHATSFCDMVLKEKSFDFVVRGEGEITFFELCDAILSKKTKFNNINGLAYRNKNGNIFKTKDRELIKNISELPAIDYSLVDVKSYATLLNPSPYAMRSPALQIITSRGCPGKCVFCTVKAVWGKSWRGKNAQKTVDEIELLHKQYGINEFSILDDSASVNKKRWNEICDEIISRKLNIKWTTPNGIAHWTLDKPTLKKMKKAGCYRVTFGIESGNEETRKFIGKTYSLKQAKEMIQYANKIGMWTICTNIFGFPYETKEQMNDTLKFAKKCGTDFATFYILSPVVTSDVYTYFKKEGLLDFDFIFNDNILDETKYEDMFKILSEGGTPTKNFTAAELSNIQMQAYRSFFIYRALTFLNPLRILKKIRSIEDFKYTMRLIYTGIKLLAKSFYKRTTRSLLWE